MSEKDEKPRRSEIILGRFEATVLRELVGEREALNERFAQLKEEDDELRARSERITRALADAHDIDFKYTANFDPNKSMVTFVEDK